MRGSLYVFLGACSYGVLSTIVVLAYRDDFSLNDVVGSQMVIGAFLLWMIVIFTRKRSQVALPSPKQPLSLLLVGTTTGLTGLFYYWALKYLPPSLAVVLFFQFTWIGLLLEAVFLKKFPEKTKLLSLIPIFLGTFLATNLLNDSFSSLSFKGVVFALLAAVSNALFIFMSGRVALQVQPMQRSKWIVTGGAIICSILVPPPSFFQELFL